MRTTSWAGRPARVAVGAFLAVAALITAASPGWAGGKPAHRQFSYPSTTVAAGAATQAGGLFVSPPSAPQDNCVRGAWPSAVEGRPTLSTTGGDAAYLWQDPDGGWALRVTHSGAHDKAVFAGSLTSARGKFMDVTPVSGGGNDIVVEALGGHTIFFRFVDYGLVDGLNFATQCAKAFSVDIHQDGRLVSASDVHLGASGANPTSNPFRVERTGALGAFALPSAAATTSTTAGAPTGA